MVLVVLFFVVSFLTIGGTYLNIDPYDNLICIKTIIHFTFLVFTMTIIPFCYKKFSKNSNIKEDVFRDYMLRVGELATDVGSVIYGEEAVQVGLIDSLGGLSDALNYLHEEIAKRRANEKE